MKNRKFEEIDNKIREIQAKKGLTKKTTIINSKGLNIAIELVAGTFSGVIIGLLFDNLFDSKPIFLIICLILSIIATFKTIWIRYVNTK